MAKRSKSRPTTKKRSARQKVKARYAKAREDAQHLGVIPTTPEGAVRDERVDPAEQGAQPLPGLIGRAVRNGWAVPDETKPRIVDELVGIVEGGEEIDHHVRVSAARVLQQGDQQQWERDNPELAGRSKGGVKVGVQVNNGQVLTPQMVLDAVLAEAKANPTEARRRLDELKALEQGEPDDVQGVSSAPETDGGIGGVDGADPG